MHRMFFGVMLVILAALVFGQAALAQSAPDTIEMIGIVEAVGDGTLTINGQTVQIATAEINVALSTGQIVKVEGTLLTDGSIVAREVQAPDDNDPRPGEIELTGQVESITGDIVTINGMMIDLSLAEIEGALEVGATVKVHASLADDGTLTAREAENVLADDDMNDDDDRAGEFEIIGTLDAVGDGFIVVNGQRIEISGAEIKNALVAGALVKVHLSNQGNQLVAREVENALDDEGDDRDDDDDDWDDTYTVRPGDTLSSIAARTGTTVEELTRVNNIADTSVIVAGTRLRVPHEVESFVFDDDDDDDNSGPGSHDDDNDDDDDNSGPGSHDDDDDNSGPGSHDDNDKDDDD